MNGAEPQGYVSQPLVQCFSHHCAIHLFIYPFNVVEWLHWWPHFFTSLCIHVLHVILPCPSTLTFDLSMWLLDQQDIDTCHTETWKIVPQLALLILALSLLHEDMLRLAYWGLSGTERKSGYPNHQSWDNQQPVETQTFGWTSLDQVSWTPQFRGLNKCGLAICIRFCWWVCSIVWP